MLVSLARRVGRHAALTTVAALVAIACADPGIAASPSVDRVPVRLDDRPLTLLAAGPDGMRDRDDFDGADGMLFDLGRTVGPSEVVWVMDRVRMPLAIAWFDDAGRLVGTSSMVPCPAEPCPTYAAPSTYRWAIEAPAGAFDALPRDARLEMDPAAVP